MATLHQVRIAWSGTLGGPGVSTFYFDATGAPPVSAAKTFFEAIKAYLPTAVVLTYPSSGITIDTATGQAVGAWSGTAPTNTTGTGAGAFSRASGAVVNWKSGAYVNGRELRGKTFLVPLIGGAYSSNGNIDSTVLGVLQTAATNYAAAINGLRIWSKATASAATVTSAQVATKVAVLRSRRD